MARTSPKQLEIKLDKNGQRRGGKRKGAGRPKRGARASERHNNAATGHRGSVFSDRYFPRVLKTPTQVRNCLAYVLNNWKHHGETADALRRPWPIDPYSTASMFDGWKELDGRRIVTPSGYDGPMVWWPCLLYTSPSP